MSRLRFRCLRCLREGSRNECHEFRPGEVPGFRDQCPNCRSTDVEVLDPAVYGAGGAPAGEASAASSESSN